MEGERRSRPPLEGACRNVPAFLNGLFDPPPGAFGMSRDEAPSLDGLLRGRLLDRIYLASLKGAPRTWLIGKGELTTIVEVLAAAWLDDDDKRGHPLDRLFLGFVRDYVRQWDVGLFVPEFQPVHVSEKSPPSFTLMGYDGPSFFLPDPDDGFGREGPGPEWVAETVKSFLLLLLSGAHFVVIHSERDLPADLRGGRRPPDDFCRAFAAACSDQAAEAHEHPHYPTPFASRAWSFPKPYMVEEAARRDQAPLLPAVLVGSTAGGDANSFFQLEAWPADLSAPRRQCGEVDPDTAAEVLRRGGYRHGCDFPLWERTGWNTSTYGASLHNEARGGTVFLAPYCWIERCRPSPDTIMAPYRGVSGDEDWLRKDELVFFEQPDPEEE